MATRRTKYRVGGKACAAFGCSNTAYSIPNVSLHVFPNPESDKARHVTWVKAVKRTRAGWNGPPAKKSPAYENCVLCSDHFEETCFEEISDIKRQSGYKCRSAILKPNAIPTKFVAEECSIEGENDINTHKKDLNGAITISDEDRPESKGMVIAVNEIPSSTMPASELCKQPSAKRSRKKGFIPLTSKDVQVFGKAKPRKFLLTNVGKAQEIPNFHNCLALLHHDYIRTMTKSLKNYILSKQAASENRLLSNHKLVSDEKFSEAPLEKVSSCQVVKLISKYGGKSKLYGNCSSIRNSRSKLSNDEPPYKVQSDEANAPKTPNSNTKKSSSSDTRKSGSSGCKKPKRRKHLTLYHGKTKLQRNPHRRYRRKRERLLLDKTVGGLSVKEEPSWNGRLPYSTGIGRHADGDKDHCQSYEKHVLQSLYAMQKGGIQCDFTLTVGSPRTLRQFPLLVHKLIFSSVSNKIKAHGGNVLDASQYLYKLDAAKFIEFVYTGKIEDINSLAEDEILRLYKAAVFLDIPKFVYYLRDHQKVDDHSLSNHESKKGGEVPQLDGVVQSLERDTFDVADIRIKRVVSHANDTTDTSSDDEDLWKPADRPGD